MRKLPLYIFLCLCVMLSSCKLDAQSLAIREAIDRQMATYPESTLQDVYKSFYQDRFGPGHMISDTASARSYLMREISKPSGCSPQPSLSRDLPSTLSHCGAKNLAEGPYEGLIVNGIRNSG